MQLVQISKIKINREGRQRREVKNVDSLAESIARNADSMSATGGLIHPIVISRDYQLVAGERRLSACISLGYSHIATNFADELDNTTLRLIELEENIKREDISWQDQCRALEELHILQKSLKSDWTIDDTAKAVGLSRPIVTQNLSVAKELKNPRVAEQPKFSTAKGIVERANARREATAVDNLRVSINAPSGTPEVIHDNFNAWGPAYDGPVFNFIHCDFPYGIGAGNFDQGSGRSFGGYEDTPETYWALCNTLAAAGTNVISESAHLIFWFSMEYYYETLEFFKEETDWQVSPYPLIWHKSDGGILPDAQRGPRRKYETAFFGSRGDRKIVGAVDNIYQAPLVRDRHMSEKPEPMLRYFFRMVVDEHTRMLDPTSGSGSALRAARSLKAEQVLGIEMNKDYYEMSLLALKGLG